MKIPYICPMGIHQDVELPCPRCGADEETEDGCLGFKQKLHAEWLPIEKTKKTVWFLSVTDTEIKQKLRVGSRVYLSGVIAHPDCPIGELVLTSPIVRIADDEIETLNTVYKRISLPGSTPSQRS